MSEEQKRKRNNGANICNQTTLSEKYTEMNRTLYNSFIHSGHFNSAPSSPLLLRGAPDYSTDTVSKFHAEAHRQLQVKDLPKVPTGRLEWESNPHDSPVESHRLN